MHTLYVQARGGAPDTLELELRVVGGCHVGAGNPTQVFLFVCFFRSGFLCVALESLLELALFSASTTAYLRSPSRTASSLNC